MPIPGSTLGSWSHHYSGEAPKQAQLSIRGALDSYECWAEEADYDVFLQGSYKNDTNLRLDSDVDVVVQLTAKLRPRVAAISGPLLEQNQAYKVAYGKWKSFRNQVLKALRATYGTNAVTPGRKSLKLAKGNIPASADVIVTLRCGTGVAFYLTDEHRWVVSYPQQHHAKGRRKERGTNNTYKQTIRMFKVARNHPVKNHTIGSRTAPSYFIECLLYNVPNDLFRRDLGESYCGIVEYLASANLPQFKCQNEVLALFGQSRDLWSVDEARTFVRALRRLWEKWPEFA